MGNSFQTYLVDRIEKARLAKNGNALTEAEFQEIRNTTAELHRLGFGPHTVTLGGPESGPWWITCDCELASDCVRSDAFSKGFRLGLERGTYSTRLAFAGQRPSVVKYPDRVVKETPS